MAITLPTLRTCSGYMYVNNLYKIEQKLQKESHAWTKTKHHVTYDVVLSGEYAGATIIRELHPALIGYVVGRGKVSVAVYDTVEALRLVSTAGRHYINRLIEYPDDEGPLFISKP